MQSVENVTEVDGSARSRSGRAAGDLSKPGRDRVRHQAVRARVVSRGHPAQMPGMCSWSYTASRRWAAA
jgi:hypothetical protein